MPRTWFSWTDSVLVGSNRLQLKGCKAVFCQSLSFVRV